MTALALSKMDLTIGEYMAYCDCCTKDEDACHMDMYELQVSHMDDEDSSPYNVCGECLDKLKRLLNRRKRLKEPYKHNAIIA
jgi:predicted component of type VI protein secretion system